MKTAPDFTPWQPGCYVFVNKVSETIVGRGSSPYCIRADHKMLPARMTVAAMATTAIIRRLLATHA